MRMNRIIILVIALMSAVAGISAQTLIPQQNKKGKWGYVNGEGKVVIDYKYDTALAFVDGRAKVEKGNKWGYIGPDGKEVIKIQYSEMSPWENNRCKVAVGGNVKNEVLTGAKWGYISYNGDIMLKPEYDKIGTFAEDGLAYVVKGNQYGYINRNLDFVIPCKYSAIGKFNDQGLCWVATGGKLSGNKINGAKFGVCDMSGRLVVPVSYKHIGTFTQTILEANPVLAEAVNSLEAGELYRNMQKEASKGMGKKSFAAAFTGSTDEVLDEAKERAKSMNEQFVSKMSGNAMADYGAMLSQAPVNSLLGYKFIDEELFSELDMSRSPYFAVSNSQVVSDQNLMWLIKTKASDKIGIITRDGTVILKPGNYSVAFPPSDDMIPVVKVNKEKLQVNYVTSSDKAKNSDKLLFKKWIDATGIAPFKDGVAVISGKDSHYMINRDGSKISSDYAMIFPARNGDHLVKGNSGFGLIGSRGNEILVPDWHLIYPESNGMYCAQKQAGGKFGYLDTAGQYVIQPRYAEARSFAGSTASVKTDAGWGMIDAGNHTVVDCRWAEIMPLSEYHPDVCWVHNGNKWSALDVATGKAAFGGEYHGVTNFNENGLAIVNDDLNLYGCINKSGEVVIPMRMGSVSLVMSCLDYMNANKLERLSDIEAFRYNLNNNPVRNNYRLSHTIDNSMWDY